MRITPFATAAFVLLCACSKKASDVQGQWEVEIEKTTESVAADPADLNLDPRMQRIKSMSRIVPAGDRAEIVNARKMELRPVLTQTQMQLDFRADGAVVISAVKDGTRVDQPPQDWKLVDGKVLVNGGARSFEFDGAFLKGALFEGHPGAAFLRRR